RPRRDSGNGYGRGHRFEDRVAEGAGPRRAQRRLLRRLRRERRAGLLRLPLFPEPLRRGRRGSGLRRQRAARLLRFPVLSERLRGGLRVTIRPGRLYLRARNCWKNAFSSLALGSASTPLATCGRWFRRPSARRLYRLPAAPALGSMAPKMTRPTRALTMAPAHMQHGSRVTTSVQWFSRQSPTSAAARRMAMSSAC